LGELLSISLHGDYRYDPLKNTEGELQQQEKVLSEYLLQVAKDTHLIVCGYSGRDKSIMETLQRAYSQSGTGILYWCGYGDEMPSPVQSLLDIVRANGRTAFFVPTNGFDDLMKRLSLYCLTDSAADKARSIIAQAPEADLPKASFNIPDNLPIKTIIKSNAFEVECPSNLIQFSLKKWPDKEIWKWIENLTAAEDFAAVPYRGKILALGNLDHIKASFNDNLLEPIERVPVDQNELYYEDALCDYNSETTPSNNLECKAVEKKHGTKF
jgi:hypothetical protein